MDVPFYQLFYVGEGPPTSRLSARGTEDGIEWGSFGEDAKMLHQFRRAFRRNEPKAKGSPPHGAENGGGALKSFSGYVMWITSVGLEAVAHAAASQKNPSRIFQYRNCDRVDCRRSVGNRDASGGSSIPIH